MFKTEPKTKKPSGCEMEPWFSLFVSLFFQKNPDTSKYFEFLQIFKAIS